MGYDLINKKHVDAVSVKCSDLLCCPFCGGIADIVRLEYQNKKYYKVFCTKCNVRQYRKRKKHKAISDWNQRAI